MHKHPWFTSIAIFSFSLLLVATSTDRAAAEPKPGDTITRSNVEAAKDYVSPGVAWAIENGMDLTIVPYQKIDEPAEYISATEKYSAQVSVNEKNELQNWVAGRPFPKVDVSDPKAAVKLMYNFENTAYFTDDLNVHLPDADTGAFYVDASGKRNYNVERHFIADWSRRLRFEGRLKHDPVPAFPDSEVFAKAGFYPLIEPFDLKGGGWNYISSVSVFTGSVRSRLCWLTALLKRSITSSVDPVTSCCIAFAFSMGVI